jgi:HlyD family secretion protein
VRNRILFTLSIVGIAAGILSAALFAVRPQPLAPVFNPAPNPYDHGIFANGIIESDQATGENINLKFPPLYR